MLGDKGIRDSQLSASELIQLLREMWRIRLFEESLETLYAAGEIHGTMHLCIGQEGTAVGSALALSKGDWITSTHRNHGHALAKGTNMQKMYAEILGRTTGTNQGKGGSMHIAEQAVGNLGGNGIVGGNFPIATGAALSAQLQGTQDVVLCYSGDGATNEGSFHEALNLASIWQLPVIFLIENNQYGMSSAIQEMVNVKELSTRSQSYGMPGITIDGNDILAVYDVTQKAVADARQGLGPTLIEALTYRQTGHSKSDKRAYRSQTEETLWAEKFDPIKNFETRLRQAKIITATEITELIQVEAEIIEELINVVKTEPRPTAADLMTDVYASEEYHYEKINLS